MAPSYSVDNTSWQSPNRSSRNGRPISMLVLHATVGSARSSLDWLCSKVSNASTHYLIGASVSLRPDAESGIISTYIRKPPRALSTRRGHDRAIGGSAMSSSIPHTSGVYQIACLPTGQVYIGSTTNLCKRWCDHKSDLRKQKHSNTNLQCAWDTHGADAFVFEVIEEVSSPLLMEREQYWIDRTQAVKRGFNLSPTAGSPLGVKRSAATIEKLRQYATGRKQSADTIERRTARLRGRKRNPEIGKKISAAKTGFRPSASARQNMSEAQRRRTDMVREYLITSPDGQEFTIKNLMAFCREHGFLYAALHAVVQGKRTHHKGWKCRRL
jgi:group I intron endonuclease